MRLHQNAGLAHLVFLQLQNLPQGIHLPAHVFHHLMNGVHLDFALLVAASKAKRMAICSAAFMSSGVSSSSAVAALAARLPSNCCRFSRVFGIVSVKFLLQVFFFYGGILLHLSQSA